MIQTRVERHLYRNRFDNREYAVVVVVTCNARTRLEFIEDPVTGNYMPSVRNGSIVSVLGPFIVNPPARPQPW